jgi:hypothetical protein
MAAQLNVLPIATRMFGILTSIKALTQGRCQLLDWRKGLTLQDG